MPPCNINHSYIQSHRIIFEVLYLLYSYYYILSIFKSLTCGNVCHLCLLRLVDILISLSITTQVGNQPKVKDQDCIRLHMGLLADTVRDHAKKWVTSLGMLLNNTAKEDLFSLKNQLELS